MGEKELILELIFGCIEYGGGGQSRENRRGPVISFTPRTGSLGGVI